MLMFQWNGNGLLGNISTLDVEWTVLYGFPALCIRFLPFQCVAEGAALEALCGGFAGAVYCPLIESEV